MKVLYICTWFHEALLYRQQLDGLTQRGHIVNAFNSAKYGTSIGKKFQNVFDDKVKHVECWNEWDRKLFFPRQMKIFHNLLKSYDPGKFDLIHAHLLVTSGLSARKCKKRFGVPYVASVRTTDLVGWIRLPFFHEMAIRNAREASGLLFLSDNHRREFLEKYVVPSEREAMLAKSVIIGNPLEKFWEENRVQHPKSKDTEKKVRILTVARINKVKNIPTACHAVKLLKERGYDASLTVIGAVEDEKELSKIEAYDCVEVIPFMEKEELISAYKNHDVFLLPSRLETFGRVYVEAMSQGLPVMYTRGQAFDGVFEEGKVGYAVGPDDPSEIADRVESILSNYSNISRNCIDLCSCYFEERIIDRIESFYLESLDRAGKRNKM